MLPPKYLLGYFSLVVGCGILEDMNIREVIAIDVGTASLSMALSKKGSSGNIEVVSVLRYPIDLFTSREEFDHRHRIPYLIKKNIAHGMADAHKVLSGATAIVVSVSEPFFQQHRIRKIIARKRSDDRVSRTEIDTMTENFSADAVTDTKKLSQLLRVVRSSIRRAWINGYELIDPVGYRGEELEIELEVLLISAALCDYMEEFRSTWFPRATIQYYTDPEMLGRILFESFSLLFPALLLDIGGEVTSITVVSDKETHAPCNLVFWGVRTIERRIAELLRCDMAHAESFLRRYVSQTLDIREISRIEPLLQSVANDWLSLVAQSFHQTHAGALHSIFIAGQGRDISLFRHTIEQRITDFSSSPVELRELVVSPDRLLPPKILSSGGDNVLASLLLYT